jgi:outer membrane protein TolC
MSRFLSIALIVVLVWAATGCQSLPIARAIAVPASRGSESAVEQAHFTPSSAKSSGEADPRIRLAAAATEPAGTEPAGTEPAATEPAGTEPAGTEPAGTEPAGTEPAATEPAETEPAETEPAGTEPAGTEPAGTEPAATESGETAEPLQLSEVLASVTNTFPLVRAAALQFDVAQGQLLSAEGAFDLKLKAASENGPLGFYETYRQSAGAVQPLMFGGEVFGGYRIGRGEFQPWYQERQTNDGGEFKAGLSVPLARNVNIDDRRAGLQKSAIDYSAADPQFRTAVIQTVQSASNAYWDWVAAGAREQIAVQVLELATTRNDGLKEEVRTGAKGQPVLQDNRRSILSREAKLIDARRKLQQTAAKLSIYLRSPVGEPLTPTSSQLPGFPVIEEPAEAIRSRLTQVALQTRPELRELDLAIERVDVEIAESENDLRPNVDAVLVGAQDVGAPTSKKRDKSPFELEAAVLVDVPLQRRKARGKLTSLEAKRGQIAQKLQLTTDKVRTEIDIAFAALTAAYERVQRTAEARKLAEFMAEVEREMLGAGASNLLSVALREEQAADAAGTEVDANLEYQLALAALRAAAGIDDGTIIDWAP